MAARPSPTPAIAEPVTFEPAKRPGTRLVFVIPVVIFAALALLFLVRLYSGDPSKVPSALIGRPVPPLTLAPLAGLTAAGQPVPGLSEAELTGDKVTVVNVWASWCAPCRLEHPVLIELAKDASIRLVGINYKDNPENARRFLGQLGNPFAAVGVDPNGRAAIDWGVYGVPETFVIGPDGRIRHKHIGPILPGHVDGFREKLRTAVN